MPREGEWRSYFRPRKTLAEIIGLRGGMVLLDVGCGYGTFAIPASEIVGNKGHVYAIDIDRRKLEQVQKKATRKGLSNLTAILGDISSPSKDLDQKLAKSVDVVLLANVLHGVPNKVRFLRNIRRLLRSEGFVAVLNWKLAKTPRGPPMKMRPSIQQSMEYLTKAGYSVPTAKLVPPYHYVVVGFNSREKESVGD